MIVDKKFFPNLAKAVTLDTDHDLGLCIHRSAALVLDIIDLQMVFAVFNPDPSWKAPPGAADEPFIHCFTEIKEYVVSPSRLEIDGKLERIPKAVYYHMHNVTEMWRLTRAQVKRVARDIRFDRVLKGLNGDGSVGAAFLDAAGVPWTESACGGLIPRPKP